MSKFHALTIQDVKKETPDCISLTFKIPDNLQKKFQYIPGQYLVLKTIIDGEEVRRSYSISSSPIESELRVAIKQIEGGLFSTFANTQLQIGDTLEVMPPDGNFGKKHLPNEVSHALAFAAGSGITPIISILKDNLESNPENTFTLFYGNKNQYSIIFQEALAALKNKYINRLQVFHILSQENTGNDLFHGRINEEKCIVFAEKLFNPKTIDSFYLCGPVEMTESISQALKNQDVDASKIHFELFTAAKETAHKEQDSKIKKSAVFNFKLDITIDNETFNISAKSNAGTLLEIGTKAGLDLPFSCMGGVCCTCRAKLLEGEVEMDVNYALEEDEVENGYILSCQSRPKTNTIKLDFDA